METFDFIWWIIGLIFGVHWLARAYFKTDKNDRKRTLYIFLGWLLIIGTTVIILELVFWK